MSQFNKVNCQYGAPMGRPEYIKYELPEGVKIRLFKVKLNSQGYDDGGAYWGLGKPLYCAQAVYDSDYREFFRCNSRDEAKEMVKQRIKNAKFYR